MRQREFAPVILMVVKLWWLAIAAGAAFAQTDAGNYLKVLHEREDQSWAQKSGLAASDVRSLRVMAGLQDDSSARILQLDAETLAKNHHVLLVEGAGHCVKLHVFDHTTNDYNEVWSASEVPVRSGMLGEIAAGPGNRICSQAPRPPTAHATPDGRIVLEVPVFLDPGQRTLPALTYTFAWDGKKYALVSEDR